MVKSFQVHGLSLKITCFGESQRAATYTSPQPVPEAGILIRHRALSHCAPWWPQDPYPVTAHHTQPESLQNPVLHLQAGRRRLQEGRPCSATQEVRGVGQAWRLHCMRRGSSGAAGSKDWGTEWGRGARLGGGENRLAPQGPVKIEAG